ncbi:MAG TPA: hypothetical protein VJH22_05725 [Candidatus Nanoarchaeia archaeon]|nr:hypothetical protein [Candidatus Nanoarchaeia archaeon]
MSVSEELGARVLTLVVENLDYFRPRPPHLAWAMMQYELVCRADAKRQNPVDAVLDVKHKLLSSDGHLLYDAWCASVIELGSGDTNPNLPLESQPNKTFDEWVGCLRNPQYRFRDLYPDDFSVRNELFCGTNHEWNADGFIIEHGPSGIDSVIFAGYSRCEEDVDPILRERILDITADPRIASRVQAMRQGDSEIADRIYAGWSWAEARNPAIRSDKESDAAFRQSTVRLLASLQSSEFRDPNREWLIKDLRQQLEPDVVSTPQLPPAYSDLFPSSNLVTMPSHAHPSYVTVGIEIAQVILADTRTSAESKRHAQAFLDARSSRQGQK